MIEQSIEGRWRKDDSKRWSTLDRARHCSSLTKPWVLPPEGYKDGQSKLPEPFTSLAARGVTNLEGRLLLALYPPGRNFFALKISSDVRYNPAFEPEMLDELNEVLFLQEMTMMSMLESAYVGDRSGNRRSGGFRSRKRTAISQLLITGDVLEQLTDDYRIKVFRRDQYVTQRDSAGDVLYHIIKERIDPLTLSEEQISKCGLDLMQLKDKSPDDRMKDLYTLCEWQPIEKTWLIQQECQAALINESEDKVSPFMSTPYELAPGEHYGRGLIELNLGDVRSLNELTMALLDFAATASKQLFALDYNSQVRAEDLTKETGSVIQARVQGGQVMDVAMIRADKMQDFQVTAGTRDSLRKDLAAVMLMEGETQPRGDRVTAFQVQRVAMELEGALGGVYGSIADAQQIPLIERVMFQMKRDKIMPAMPKDGIEIEALTGISALSREGDGGKLMQVLQTMAQMGPEMMSKINMDHLIDLMMRQAGIYEPGLIKSQEQVQQEQQAAQQQQMQQQAASKAVDVMGNVAEQDMAPPQEAQ